MKGGSEGGSPRIPPPPRYTTDHLQLKLSIILENSSTNYQVSKKERTNRVLMTSSCCFLRFLTVFLGGLKGELGRIPPPPPPQYATNHLLLKLSLIMLEDSTTRYKVTKKEPTHQILDDIIMLFLEVPGFFFSEGGLRGGGPRWTTTPS